MKGNNSIDNNGEVLIYRPKTKGADIEARLDGDTIWLTIKQLSELFAVGSPAITKHVKNIYDSKELAKKINYFQNGNSST